MLSSFRFHPADLSKFACFVANRLLTTSLSSAGRATRQILHNLASKSVATRHRAFSYT